MSRLRRLAVGLLGILLLSACVSPPPPAGPPPAFRLLAGRYQLARDPDNPALTWVRTHLGGESSAAEPIEQRIAYTPVARSFTAQDTDLAGHVHDYVAQAARQRWQPMLVGAFTEPGRCPEAGSPAVADFARGLGQERAIVVLEPGLLLGDCPGAAAYLAAVVHTIRTAAPNVFVFLDVSGNDDPSQYAGRLLAAGVREASGITVNVGRYASMEKLAGPTRRLFDALAASTGRRDYFLLADSARNGATVTDDCNPAGAKPGSPGAFSDEPGALQQAWLTVPGVSDGPCGTAPGSRRGEFVPDLARQMAG
ncbi:MULTISPECIES: glycoside hydrolase family 6 protein [Amycolatopsis]|uniref:Endoglucanase n=1 Tax=Amycolatopsis sacchari TaxID=115433 RepID=A0A1I3MKD5_9PSEU|nr:glycoside hydrolase family 6 protein [Amycolatopsis sacchari]SFI97220.1 endoglucanase [Amycolatopsis sacchari]